MRVQRNAHHHHRCSPTRIYSRSATWHDADILCAVLNLVPLPELAIVVIRNGLAQRLDAGSRAIFSAGYVNVDGLGALETALDVVLNLCNGGLVCGVLGKSAAGVSSPRACKWSGLAWEEVSLLQVRPGPDWPISLALQRSQTRQLARCTRQHRSRLELHRGRRGVDVPHAQCGIGGEPCWYVLCGEVCQLSPTRSQPGWETTPVIR